MQTFGEKINYTHQEYEKDFNFEEWFGEKREK